MIVTREIKIRINEINYQYYEELGYDIFVGDELLIPIELLTRGSNYKIECKCDTCNITKLVIFKNYIKYNNKWGFYYCRKCSEKKRKESLNKSYGVDYPIQNPIVLERFRKSILNK